MGEGEISLSGHFATERRESTKGRLPLLLALSLSLSLSLSLPTGRPIAFNELTHHVVIFVVEHWSTENRQIEKRERRRTRERFLFLRRGGRNKKCFVSLSFISFLFF